MGRPMKKVHKETTNLTLDPAIKRAAKKYAFDAGYDGISSLVEELLEKEIKRSKELRDAIAVADGADSPPIPPRKGK